MYFMSSTVYCPAGVGTESPIRTGGWKVDDEDEPKEARTPLLESWEQAFAVKFKAMFDFVISLICRHPSSPRLTPPLPPPRLSSYSEKGCIF